MPSPRVFISSTCYDLRDIRHALRQFIGNFGFEPVMSEFGDIFYQFDAHVQDACISAIEKCNLFVLIIGTQYGSTYHANGNNDYQLDSVTLQEFKKALDLKIPKHIFIDRFLEHDYQNFRHFLQAKLQDHFKGKEFPEDAISVEIDRVRKQIDMQYHFPQKAYQNIFHFLDLIYDLKTNNAIFKFETFEDIEGELRKQWAGYMYEALTSPNSVSSGIVQTFTSKLDALEKILKTLVSSKIEDDNSGKISLNIENLSQSFLPSEIQEAQSMFEDSIKSILYDDNGNERGYFTQELDEQLVADWLNNLGNILNDYKWTKTIAFESLFNFKLTYYTKRNREIPTLTLLRFYGLYNGMDKEQKESFAKSVLLKFNPHIRPEVDESDIPF